VAERGNRNQRIDPVSLQLLEAALQTHYATPQAKDAYLSVEGRSERKWELILEEWREQHAHLTRVDEQLEWLKSLSNRTHVLFVLAGPCALFGFRNTSGQLARRGRDIHFARCLEMEARAGERKIAMHESESAKQFQALLSKPAMPANGQGAQAQGTRHEARDLKSKGERVKFPWHQIYCG
jgi:hypothetical protein